MYAYHTNTNAFYLRTDIVPTQYEDITVPTVNPDGTPIMEYRPAVGPDGNKVMEDYTLEDGTTMQMPIMEQVQATHESQRPVYLPLPKGYVDVSEEEHRSLFEAQAQGNIIQPDPAGTGRPVALPPPAPTNAELLTAAQHDKMQEISRAHEAALAGAVALSDPTPNTVAVESALLAVQDAEGLEYVRDQLAKRRSELESAVQAASTVPQVLAIAVNYKV